MSAGASDRSHAAFKLPPHPEMQCIHETPLRCFFMFSQCKQGAPTHTHTHLQTQTTTPLSTTPLATLLNECHESYAYLLV